jgi:hypothetical protein
LAQPVILILIFIGGNQLHKKTKFITLTLSILFQLTQVIAVQAQDNAVMTALEKELNRTFAKLHTSPEVPIYFMGYRLYDTESLTLAAES